jgi:hypothetical protein
LLKLNGCFLLPLSHIDGKIVDTFEPLGFAKLEEPNCSHREVDAMDGRHLLLLATGTRTIRISDGEAEELVEFSGPASG